MCGIAGVVGPEEPSQGRVASALRLMRHRGPDAEGVMRARLGRERLTLLHTRLAIIDLGHRADQPFELGDCALVFNGELYNYRELRIELERAGLAFRTFSDTEVVVQAYRHWGTDCFDRFEGMWALALLDRAHGTLLLSRDRFGEKPLFLMRHGGSVFFGSQTSFLATLAGRRPEVDQEQLWRYLVYGYKALYKRSRTYYRDVQELPAGTFVQLTGAALPEPTPYWTLEYAPVAMSEREAVDGVRERLHAAVGLRLRADVPIALCLSGGVDSTALAGIAVGHFGQDLHAFSIVDSDERYHELDNISMTVAHLGCPHTTIQTSADGFFERLADLVAYHDAPVATMNYYLHSFLSQAVSESGYKVAISGTAADELFTGYYDHYLFWLASMSDRPDADRLVAEWRESYGRFVRNPFLQDPQAFVHRPEQRHHIFLDDDVFRGLLVKPFEEPFEERDFTPDLLRNRMMNELFHEAVPVILKEDDLNSMRWSVENRSPYLDRSLAEFCFTIPPEHLIRDGYPKWLLREAVKGLVPDAVRLDKRKRGFNASIDSLVDRSDPATMERLLEMSPIWDFVDRDRMTEYVEGSMEDNSRSKFLFSFISAKLFLEHYESWRP
jgi:asparagine synthase (glutamine-hydrolysing)